MTSHRRSIQRPLTDREVPGFVARRVRARTAAGLSLVEVVISLVIVGMIITGVIQGVLVSASTASTTRGLVTADAVLSGIAERMKALVEQSNWYQNCASAAELQTKYLNDDGRFPKGSAPAGQLDGATLTIDSVQYWNGTNQYVNGCGTDRGLQLVSMRVTVTGGPAGPATVSGVVVLRKPALA